MFACAILTACGPRYAAPTEAEPHAAFEVQTIYHHTPTRRLHEEITINGEEMVDVLRRSPIQGRPIARSVRVRPAPTNFHVRSRFSYVQQQVRPRMERYPCGRDRRGATRYCDRRFGERSNVQQIAAWCDSGVSYTPEAGRHYLLRFEFYGQQRCGLEIFERIPNPDGTTQYIRAE